MNRTARPREALIYVALIGLFGANRVLEAVGRSPGAVRSWLDDLLVLPLALGAALALHRMGGRPAHWTLPGAQSALAAILFTVAFEVVLPVVSDRFVADPLDGVAYAVGALLFHLVLNRPAGPAPGEGAP